MAASQDPTETQSDTEPTTGEAISRYEGFVSMGMMSCDACHDMHFEDRKAVPAEFWPERPIEYIRAGERRAVDFMAATLCQYHDTTKHRPVGATHRIVIDKERLDKNRTGRRVRTVERLD